MGAQRALQLLVAIALTISLPTAAYAQVEEEPAPRSPFDQGRFSIGIGGGTQQTFDQTYFVIAGSFGYYVLSGLEVGVRAIQWFGGDPTVSKVSPQVRYILHQLPGPVKPYVGTFYTHWFVGGGFDDIDAVGARGGIVYNQGSGFVIGVGVVVETITSECISECTDVYPELAISLSF